MYIHIVITPFRIFSYQCYILLGYFLTHNIYTQMQKKNVKMELVNPNAAGIDIGSRSHFVAIGQGSDDVKEFGVYNEDLNAVADWLKLNGVKTVAMESTGTYWQSLFAVLQAEGFQVILCNGKFTKNIKGKKSDVQDCQWIQKLHSIGLLSGSFLPDEATEQLRTFCRHRSNLVDMAADTSRKMQKYLRLLNLRLDVVVNDICGLTVEGVSYSTVLTLMSEVGNGIYKFNSAKQFASWLRLSPNNKISGGKVLSNKIPKGRNRLKIALRNAANAIGNLKDTALSNFFSRISHRKGRVSAISATARKLAVIIWNMVVKGTAYIPLTEYQFVDQKRKKITAMKRLITKFEITTDDLNLQL